MHKLAALVVTFCNYLLFIYTYCIIQENPREDIIPAILPGWSSHDSVLKLDGNWHLLILHFLQIWWYFPCHRQTLHNKQIEARKNWLSLFRRVHKYDEFRFLFCSYIQFLVNMTIEELPFPRCMYRKVFHYFMVQTAEDNYHIIEVIHDICMQFSS